MASDIHPTALIDRTAELDLDVVVEAGAIVGPRCRVGRATRLRPHCQLVQDVTLGAECDVHFGAVLGGDPQDLKYQGERTLLEMGDRNVVREFVTINRGTGFGGGLTRVGHGNLIMAYVHIAHDCFVDNGCVFTNGAMLAGHIHIEDMAILSGSVLIHHFVTVGTMAFIAAHSAVRADVPPYMIVDGQPARVRKLNVEGMKRRSVPVESMNALKLAHRKLYRSDSALAMAVEEIAATPLASDPYVANLLRHYKDSARGMQGRALEASRTDGGVKSATTIIRPEDNPFLAAKDAPAREATGKGAGAENAVQARPSP